MVSVHPAATATRDGTTDPGAPPAASGRRITRRRFEGCPSPNVPPRGGSASAAGDERDDDVGGVAVEVLAAPVVDGRGSGGGVTGGDLDVSQRCAGRGVGRHGAAGSALVAFTDGQVDRPRGSGHERHGGGLVALAHDPQCAMAALEAEVLDVGGTGLADT